jgi:hypothetical protein
MGQPISVRQDLISAIGKIDAWNHQWDHSAYGTDVQVAGDSSFGDYPPRTDDCHSSVPALR